MWKYDRIGKNLVAKKLLCSMYSIDCNTSSLKIHSYSNCVVFSCN